MTISSFLLLWCIHSWWCHVHVAWKPRLSRYQLVDMLHSDRYFFVPHRHHLIYLVTMPLFMAVLSVMATFLPLFMSCRLSTLLSSRQRQQKVLPSSLPKHTVYTAAFLKSTMDSDHDEVEIIPENYGMQSEQYICKTANPLANKHEELFKWPNGKYERAIRHQHIRSQLLREAEAIASWTHNQPRGAAADE